MRVFVTPKGAALKQRVVPAAEEVNRLATAGIGADDLAATRRTLIAMIDNLVRDESAWVEAELAGRQQADEDGQP
jgi:DNA-binding MarR family transcriptional regulator